MKKLLTILLAAFFVGCTAQPVEQTQDNTVKQSTGDEEFTLTELAAFNGQGGNRCLVAIDGVVYEISSNFWVNGQHVTSNGLASCGRDLSAVITQSPHGKSILTSSAVTRVGLLQ